MRSLVIVVLAALAAASTPAPPQCGPPPSAAAQPLALGFHIPKAPLPLAGVVVIDGDTFDVGAERFRLSNLDAPETHRPRCDQERALGDRATASARRIFDGAHSVVAHPTGRRDRNGRVLARIDVDGQDFAGLIIGRGLGRPWRGRTSDWCATT